LGIDEKGLYLERYRPFYFSKSKVHTMFHREYFRRQKD